MKRLGKPVMWEAVATVVGAVVGEVVAVGAVVELVREAIMVRIQIDVMTPILTDKMMTDGRRKKALTAAMEVVEGAEDAVAVVDAVIVAMDAEVSGVLLTTASVVPAVRVAKATFLISSIAVALSSLTSFSVEDYTK